MVCFVWRVFAGLGLELAWFLVVREHTRGPIVAAGVVLVLLGDVGVLYGKLLASRALLAQLVWGDPGGLFDSYLQLHLGWRIITPGLSLPFLLV